MRGAIAAAWHAFREDVSKTQCLKMSDRLHAKTAESVSLAYIADVDAELKVTQNKCHRLGVTYMDVLKAEYDPKKEQKLAELVDRWWLPNCAGFITLATVPVLLTVVLAPVPIFGYIAFQTGTAFFVGAAQLNSRSNEFCKLIKKKQALDYLAAKARARENTEKKD